MPSAISSRNRRRASARQWHRALIQACSFVTRLLRNGPISAPSGLNMRIGFGNWLRPLSSKATVHGPSGRRTCRRRPRSATPAGGNVLRSFFPTSKTPIRWLPSWRRASWNAPKLASRHAAHTPLLGFAGGPADAARLEQRIEAAWNSHDATNLAAMIGSDLELRGPSRVGWVEAMYFADRSRTMPEIEAALLALNVHGDANRTIPRARVTRAYRPFIGERPPMAGFVAQQLADWDYWDAATEYAALLKSNTITDPASHFAVVNYLQRAASANAALE